MSASPSGFALRKNGTCGAAEVDCGRTVAPYRACCPESSFCPTQYNVDCCPTSSNCTAELVRDPQCADPTWDLYDNGGYFCCEKGLVGYAATTNSNGCAQPGYAFQEGETVLELISAGGDTDPDSGYDANAKYERSREPQWNTPDNAPAVSETSIPATSSGTPVAAIAGGTVGGVVALVAAAAVWWFLRRKRRANLEPEEKAKEGDVGVAAMLPSELDGETLRQKPGQLPEQHGVSELPG